MLLDSAKYSLPLLEVYSDALNYCNVFVKLKISKKQKIMLIKYLYNICQNKSGFMLSHDWVIREHLYGVTIRRGVRYLKIFAKK